MAKNIKELPQNDRPYEKLEQFGRQSLTNSELLAIIIRNGTRCLNCLEIAQNILKGNDENLEITDLEYLSDLSLEELTKFDGIGSIKAKQIHAVIELSSRISNINSIKKDTITCPKDMYNLLISGFLGLKQECLKTILLNKRNKIISVVTNSIGSSDKINIGIKEVFSQPIKQMANSIILAHNHPSGSLVPSKEDIKFTKSILEYSKIFDIELLDHIIIANNGYISLKEHGYL